MRKDHKYLERSKFTQKTGIWCASLINESYRLAEKRGFKLPQKIKAAIKVNGEIFEAKYGEKLHPEIALRIGVACENYEMGFTYLKVA